MKKIARMALVLAVSTGMVLGTTPAANALSSGGLSTRVNQTVTPGYYSDTLTTEAVEQELLILINQHRVNNGVAPAEVSVSLMDSAQNWSNTMAQRNKLYHSGQNVAENILRSDRPRDARHLFENWKNSPGHNNQMLNPQYKTIGVGVVYDAKGNTWATTQLYYR